MVFYSTEGTENGGFDFPKELENKTESRCYETVGSEHLQILLL